MGEHPAHAELPNWIFSKMISDQFKITIDQIKELTSS